MGSDTYDGFLVLDVTRGKGDFGSATYLGIFLAVTAAYYLI